MSKNIPCYPEHAAHIGAEMAQTPDEQRFIEQIEYSCWDTKPLSESTDTYTIRKTYDGENVDFEKLKKCLPGNITFVDRSVKRVYEDKIFVTNKFSLEFNGLPLSELGIPKKPMPFSYNYDWEITKKTIGWYNQLNIPPKFRKQFENILCYSELIKVTDVVYSMQKNENIRDQIPAELIALKESVTRNIPGPRIPFSHDFEKIMGDSTLKPVEFTDHYLNMLYSFLLKEEIREELSDMTIKVLKNPPSVRLRDCTYAKPFPTPAFYIGNWNDPRFFKPVEARVIIGTIPEKGLSAGDLDATAEYLLMDMGRQQLFRSWAHANENLEAPPNMTNMYIMPVPAVKQEILDIENEFDLRSTFWEHTDLQNNIRLVVCESPTRLNPVILYRDLNKKFGENNWILVKTGTNGELLQVKPKDKKCWKIKSTMTPATPLVLE